ncbi:unnamed protein product [Cuscuta europaea]|uniref:Reverse transcriptase zinc-binding domain-containing protein n=1 Tax=Cuscuta europaea TaxID=41803 RepID=A0A9P0ZAB2_CUSEU|nr:unnamed protein product [Cuscuta europaea]
MCPRMANFLWGTSNYRPKYHWVSWKKISYPKEEGGLDIRSLKDVERAFSLKMWWKWKTSSCFWSEFMKARYPREGDMRIKIADSPIWRRLCLVNDLATCLIDSSDNQFTWKDTKNGQFTLKSAYHAIRHSLGSSYAFKQLWHPQQQPKIKIFQWRLFKGVLPITDKLIHFRRIIQPSICPLCRNDDDSTIHIFLECDFSKAIWSYFAQIMSIPMPSHCSYIRNIFLIWWFEAGSKNLIDLFKHNLPGIICWNIWKVYTDQIWGTGSRTPNFAYTIWQIKLYTQNWVLSLSNQKLGKIDTILYEERLIPQGFKLKHRLLKPISWLKPNRGLKLNIDAAYIPDSASGGAILRYHRGELVEIDVEAVLSFLSDGFNVARSEEVVSFRQLCFRKGVRFRHIFREGNRPAHYLAALHPTHFMSWTAVNLLPSPVRIEFNFDFFNIPYIRWLV